MMTLLLAYQILLVVIFVLSLMWYGVEYRVRGGGALGAIRGVIKTALTLGPLVIAVLFIGKTLPEAIFWLLRAYIVILICRIGYVCVAPSSHERRQKVSALFQKSPPAALIVIIGLLLLFGPAIVMLGIQVISSSSNPNFGG